MMFDFSYFTGCLGRGAIENREKECIDSFKGP